MMKLCRLTHFGPTHKPVAFEHPLSREEPLRREQILDSPLPIPFDLVIAIKFGMVIT